MADDVTLPATSGTIGADEISSVKYQRIKLIHGADGTNAGDVSTVNGLPVTSTDGETSLSQGMTGLREAQVVSPYTVIADSLADGLASFWSSTTANGGTTTSSGGEGLVQTSANANGSAQLVSTAVDYYPGQVNWFKSAVRFGDTGASSNTRRIGAFTVSGTTPQNGAYYELSGTTLNAVVVTGGTPSATASASWSKAATASFTLDTNYHQFEIRFTANTVWFYIDNVLRHVVSGTTAAITATLNFSIVVQSINAGAAATNRLIAVRNCGIGRYGLPQTDIDGALIVRQDRRMADALSERVSNTDGNSTALSTFGATSGARNVIDACSGYNDSVNNVYVDIRDGTGGTILWTFPLPAKGGFNHTWPKGLKQPTANTALAYDVSAATTTVYLSFSGFKTRA